MPEFDLALLLLACAVFGAGAIRGFAGFGDALFFLPLAGLVLSPVETIMVFVLVAVFGPLPLIKNAWEIADKSIAKPLLIVMAVTTPIGFFILTQLSPDIFRTILSFMAIAVVASMVFGLHPNFHMNAKSAGILGLFCGVIGGFTGVPGSFLIFVLLNSQLRASQVRALSMIALLVFDLTILISGAIGGAVNLKLIILAGCLLPFYVLGSFIGQTIFDPEKEKIFRAVAMVAIFMSGILGLPFIANFYG